MYTPKDLAEFEKRGIDQKDIDTQIQNFIEGFPFTALKRAATIGDGINKYEDKDAKAYVDEFETEVRSKKVFKFVPASGAASRMFKDLFSFIDDWRDGKVDADSVDGEEGRGTVGHMIRNIDKMALYNDLNAIVEDLDGDIAGRNYGSVIEGILSDDGLNYGNLPKGLLQFHQYDEFDRTAVEEHLVEGALYCKDSDGRVRMHFTISPEHQSEFEKLLGTVVPSYEKEFEVSYDISFSQQKPYTDTIAVDMSNEPFREEDGSILFRPGGHGALLENLNGLDGDVIFIKNVDNVVPDRIKQDTIFNKKLIAGVLLINQKKIFQYLERMDAGQNSDAFIDEISQFMENDLSITLHEDFRNWGSDKRLSYLRNMLDRPLRVCGMVLNTGEPGGGPFWVKDSIRGSVQLQICETAQIDLEDPKQEKILKKSTHFNPTDLVCGVKNYKGKKYDLLKYRDPKTGFISYKSKNGKDLKAQELPGLWNGSMADWNTIFVEVPIITFNPVKTVFDLLRDEHLK